MESCIDINNTLKRKEVLKTVFRIRKINDLSFHEKIASIIFHNNPNIKYSYSNGEVLLNMMDVTPKTYNDILKILELQKKNSMYVDMCYSYEKK